MITHVNSIAMYYEDSGSGLPVVFLHGFPLDRTNWQPILQRLKGQARMITPDLRGFGRSEAPAGPAFMNTYVKDIVGLLDELTIEKAVLVGHSMGGYVALAFARLFPERLLGLGLVATQALPDAPDRKEARYDSAKAVASQGAVFAANSLPQKYSGNPDIQEQVRQIILRTAPNGIIAALMGMAEREDSTPFLKDIGVPSLVVAGSADMLIPAKVSQEMAVALPDTEYVEIPGGYHMLMLEHPDEVAAAVSRLLGRVQAKA